MRVDKRVLKFRWGPSFPIFGWSSKISSLHWSGFGFQLGGPQIFVGACARDEIYFSSPQSAIRTVFEVAPFLEPTFSIFLTTSIPLQTSPKTTCFPSSHAVLLVQRKNCDPLV